MCALRRFAELLVKSVDHGFIPLMEDPLADLRSIDKANSR